MLVPLTLVTALFAPLVFLGGFWAAFIGMALWGLGMGVHELATNAAKYGSLAQANGSISLEWNVVPRGNGSELTLRWKEAGCRRGSGWN